eukprot:s1337_g1.t1
MFIQWFTKILVVLNSQHPQHRETLEGSRPLEVATEFILFKHGSSPNSERLDALVLELRSSLRRIMFGSFDPPVAAPPTQSNFDHILQKIEPAMQQLTEAVAGDGDEAVLRNGQDLTTHAESIQEQYLSTALAADPVWPGHRVHLASRLVAIAYEVFQEVVLFSYDLASSETAVQEVIDRFEVAIHQLKDGGPGFAAIMMPERQDLMDQWVTVHDAWDEVLAYQSSGFQVSDLRKIENLGFSYSNRTFTDLPRTAVNNLVLEIHRVLPLLSVEDVKSPDSFPWLLHHLRALVYAPEQAPGCREDRGALRTRRGRGHCVRRRSDVCSLARVATSCLESTLARRATLLCRFDLFKLSSREQNPRLSKGRVSMYRGLLILHGGCFEVQGLWTRGPVGAQKLLAELGDPKRIRTSSGGC